MTIKFETTPDAISAVNEMLNDIIKAPALNIDSKVAKSVAYDISDKFSSRQKAINKKADLFQAKKKYGITLKFHEAYALQQILLHAINDVDNDMTKNELNKVKDTINQKMS